jgi:hypothetical protein
MQSSYAEGHSMKPLFQQDILSLLANVTWLNIVTNNKSDRLYGTTIFVINGRSEINVPVLKFIFNPNPCSTFSLTCVSKQMCSCFKHLKNNVTMYELWHIQPVIASRFSVPELDNPFYLASQAFINDVREVGDHSHTSLLTTNFFRATKNTSDYLLWQPEVTTYVINPFKTSSNGIYSLLQQFVNLHFTLTGCVILRINSDYFPKQH